MPSPPTPRMLGCRPAGETTRIRRPYSVDVGNLIVGGIVTTVSAHHPAYPNKVDGVYKGTLVTISITVPAENNVYVVSVLGDSWIHDTDLRALATLVKAPQLKQLEIEGIRRATSAAIASLAIALDVPQDLHKATGGKYLEMVKQEAAPDDADIFTLWRKIKKHLWATLLPSKKDLILTSRTAVRMKKENKPKTKPAKVVKPTLTQLIYDILSTSASPLSAATMVESCQLLGWVPKNREHPEVEIRTALSDNSHLFLRIDPTSPSLPFTYCLFRKKKKHRKVAGETKHGRSGATLAP